MHRPFALFGLWLASGALLASCRHVDPKTYVMGAVSCEPDPKRKWVGQCETCMKASCCAELVACAHDAPCPCGLMARSAFLAPPKALEVCGPMNAAFAALSSCLDAKCAEECPADDGRHHHPLVGKPAPEIAADPLGGEGPRTMEQARGKVVILDFWATWCGPCKASFPKYQELAGRFRGDVVVLAVSVDDPEHTTTDKVLAVATDTRVRFPILWDKHLRTAARYSMPKGIPTSFVVDRGGTVRSVHVGYDASLPSEVEALVKAPVPQP